MQRWALPHLVLGYITGVYPEGEPVSLPGGFNVAVICGQMGGDEPMEVIFEAARWLPDVCFNVTGDHRLLAPRLHKRVPANVRLTGYLPYGQYIGLLRSSGGIIVLTTRQQTLLMGGFEAVALGVPLLVTDTPLLREFFSRGTVHVPNTPEGVAEGVRCMQRDQASMRREIWQLRDELECQMTSQLAALENILATPPGRAPVNLVPAETGC